MKKYSNNESNKILLYICVSIIILAGSTYWNKINTETDLKFGFVTDLEYGYKNNVGNKLPKDSPDALEKAVTFFNEKFNPEIVIMGGDMVESSLSKKKTTIEQFEKINAIFSKLETRREYVFGNHDLRDLNKEELRDMLAMNDNHSYIDLGDWRFVLMDTNFKIDGSDFGPDYYVNGYVSKAEFEWLEDVLNTEKPTIIFSHHSSIPSKIDGELVSNFKNLSNGIDVHNFFKKYKNLVLVISGHEPGYRFENVEGINYLIVGNIATSQALVNFVSLEAKYNKCTKKAKIIIEKHGEYAQKFEIEKKIGKLNLWLK
jgi:alkaline phosphatase